ncbi:hypothetical protein [Luteitalea sp.]|uniref:hypothetical protein n=1 Tax=Luteitalea sp. TaxID=2004800 RepID=UPI0025BF7706|nr:hypothetical protein [Luteitalea sp.]
MKLRIRVAFAAAACVCAASPVWAQTPPVTVTPYVAFGTDGAAPVGAMITLPIAGGLSVDSEVAYRRGEGEIHAMSSSLSLLQNLSKIGRVTPYLAAGVGLAQYGTPVLGAEGAPSGTAKRLGPTVNVGGGFTAPVTSAVGFRMDARYSDGLGKGGDQFRIANGVTFGSSRKPK